MLRTALLCALILVPHVGCELVPEVVHEPTIRNPFPELSRVAIAPFFNLSDEPTVDGRRFALAYYAELQEVPGFEVVPLSVVETAMRQYRLQLDDPRDARRLAQLLEVDAVVVGAVTDYSPYYPPRLGLDIQWWAANGYLPSIPPGYGLPWCTPEEEYIPERLVYETEMALARAQVGDEVMPVDPSVEELPTPPGAATAPVAPRPGDLDVSHGDATGRPPADWIGPDTVVDMLPSEHAPLAIDPSGTEPRTAPALEAARLPSVPIDEPVLRHTFIYNGHDRDVTEALATYFFFRDDARFGGWESYLQRSEDFIRFCCHMHIAQMLSARGGAGQTRVAWRWSHGR